MLYLKAKAVKQKVKALNKQINKEALGVLDKKVSQYIDALLAKQENTRITAANITIE